jgi:hypothetical protein
VGYCYDILTHDEIAATIREDGARIEDLKVDVVGDCWVKFVDGDKQLGVAFFHPIYSGCFDAHIHVLPEFRKEYTKEIGLQLWQWVEENLPDSLIVTHVPKLYENVRRFLLMNEFKEVGTLEKAFLKEGKKQDMWIMSKRTI